MAEGNIYICANLIANAIGKFGGVATHQKGEPVQKYRNKKVKFDGLIFDSKKEARRYQELKLLEELGEISNLETQVDFTLIPSQYQIINGKKKCVERPCKYKADFVYIEEGRTIVEDTKGFRTKDYIIKRKLMLKEYGIQIKEI